MYRIDGLSISYWIITLIRITSIVGAKRAIIKSASQKPVQYKRHNSWHDLVKCGSAPALGGVSHNTDSQQYINLFDKQEAYIHQLEEENKFCREQISGVLSQLNTSKSFIADDEFIIPVREDNSNQQQLENLEAENTALRQQLQTQALSIDSQEHNRNIIERLRADNEMLTQALSQLSGESEEVKKREAEAAEEV